MRERTPDIIHSEESEIKRMADKGLLTPEETVDFDFEKEIQAHPQYIKEFPKISERLREGIISKFPPESFEPENISDTLIHGTYLYAIRDIWFGTGRMRTNYDGYTEKGAGMIFSQEGLKRGEFNIKGFFSKLGKDGFNHRKQDRRCITHNEKKFPIVLVLNKLNNPGQSSGEFQIELDPPQMKEITQSGINLRAIILPYEYLRTIDSDINGLKELKVKIQNNEPVELRNYSIQDQFFAEFMERFDRDLKGDEINPLLEEVIDELKNDILIHIKNSEERLKKRHEVYSDDDYLTREMSEIVVERRKVLERFDSIIEKKQFSNSGDIKSKYMKKLEAKMIYDGSLEKILDSVLVRLEKTRSKIPNQEQERYEWGTDGTNLKGRVYLSLDEVTKYIANTMVDGIDKSKIVPIYDWNGKLLWPKETSILDTEDVSKETATTKA